MLIWGTVVTPLQAFGYAIALGGIVYYKLGYTAVMGIFTDIGHHWNRNPLVRRILFAALAFVALFFLLQGFSGSASTQNAGSMGNMD
ncbi:hypothetical protein IMZ48_24330, partial [Candidatus Bathyarchaeota archaeon]|nr:hypothetical protein [Candidatus Bathyarchaeota archaeon]